MLLISCSARPLLLLLLLMAPRPLERARVLPAALEALGVAAAARRRRDGSAGADCKAGALTGAGLAGQAGRCVAISSQAPVPRNCFVLWQRQPRRNTDCTPVAETRCSSSSCRTMAVSTANKLLFAASLLVAAIALFWPTIERFIVQHAAKAGRSSASNATRCPLVRAACAVAPLLGAAQAPALCSTSTQMRQIRMRSGAFVAAAAALGRES